MSGTSFITRKYFALPFHKTNYFTILKLTFHTFQRFLLRVKNSSYDKTNQTTVACRWRPTLLQRRLMSEDADLAVAFVPRLCQLLRQLLQLAAASVVEDLQLRELSDVSFAACVQRHAQVSIQPLRHAVSVKDVLSLRMTGLGNFCLEQPN